MTERVVDDLEIVEVDVRQGDRTSLAPAQRENSGRLLVESPPVEQRRERVGAAQPSFPCERVLEGGDEESDGGKRRALHQRVGYPEAPVRKLQAGGQVGSEPQPRGQRGGDHGAGATNVPGDITDRRVVKWVHPQFDSGEEVEKSDCGHPERGRDPDSQLVRCQVIWRGGHLRQECPRGIGVGKIARAFARAIALCRRCPYWAAHRLLARTHPAQCLPFSRNSSALRS